jgi:hypothetical protein
VTNAKLATDVKVGSLAALTTTEKASVVGAINEVKTGLGAVADGYVTNAKLATDVKVGSLAALTTTEKASVVGAINEVKTGQSNVESIGRTQVEYDFNGVVLTDTTNTNNSISITPVAAKTVTANGNAKISTTEYNVGSSSGYFDGAGDTLTIADSSDFNISTGDWTIKCKIRSNNMGVRKDFVAKRRAAQPEGWNIYHASNGAICMDAKIGTYGQRLASASTFSANTWLDIQINRSGDVYRLFVDGTLEDSETISGNIDNYAVALAIGTGASTSENDFAGYIDEFEFSKGIARNTSDYTPSTDPIVPDSYTKLLLHFEGANNSTTFTDDPTQKTTATAIKSYNPINISSWSNVKWSTATPTDTSVTVDVLDSSNNVIASSITSVKDLSTINSSTYPTIKIRWTLARVTGAETSPTVTLPSLAWVGSKYLTATATYDPVSLTTGSQTSTTVTVTGAALGDFVSASFSVDNALIQVTVYVSAANTVTLVLRNGTAGTIDLASGTLTVKVWRY